MPPIYRIRRWDEVFAVNRSREIKNPKWVPWPLRLGGAGYAALIGTEKGGAARYGVWAGIVTMGATCEPPGTLLRRNGTPYGPAEIALVTRMDREDVDDAWAKLISIGWLEPCGISQEGARLSQEGALDEMREDEKRREEIRLEKKSGDAEPSPTPAPRGARKKSWTAKQIHEIYWAYCKRVKPKEAYKAIRKALGELPGDLKTRGKEPTEDEHAWLLERTKLRTASPLIRGKLASGEKRYIDHPASWFNAGGHLEDPETWKEDESGGQPSEATRRRAEKRGKEYDDKPSLR